MIRVRNANGTMGWAQQLAAPSSIRDIVVDSLSPITCDIGDYLVALDDGTWDAVGAAQWPGQYTLVQG